MIEIQYLGGKSRISKNISEVINEISGWEVKDSNGNCGINQSINQRHSLVYFVGHAPLKVK